MDKLITFLVYVLTFLTAMCLYQGELALSSFVFTRFTQVFLALFAVYLLLMRRAVRPGFFISSLAVYSLWLVCSISWSSMPEYTYPAAIRFVYFTVYCYIIYNTVRTQKQFENILLIVTAAAGVFVVGTLYNYLTRQPFIFDPMMPTSSGIRYSFLNINPNYTSTVVACTLPLAWWLFYIRRRNNVYISALLGAFLTIAPVSLLLMGSRGATYATAVTVVYVIATIVAEKKHTKQLVWVGCAIIVGFFMFQYFQNQGNMYKAIDRLFGSGMSLDDKNAVERFQFWGATWDLFLKHPIIGVGQSVIVHSNAIGRNAISHNSALGILAETGLIGFSIFLTTILASFWNAIHGLNKIKYALVSCLLISVLISSKDSFDPEGFFWLFLVLPSLSHRLRKLSSQETVGEPVQIQDTDKQRPALNNAMDSP